MISELAIEDLFALEASGLLPQRKPGRRSTNHRRAIGVQPMTLGGGMATGSADISLDITFHTCLS